jgi:RimJ/RimL family protein N-acetyltransferase
MSQTGHDLLSHRPIKAVIEKSPMSILETERLHLRPLLETDLDDLCALYADLEVMRNIGNGLPRNREQTAERLHRALAHWQKYGFGIWTVCDKSDGRFLGRCGYGNWRDYPDMELAYILHRFAWGKGYCTEAARAVVRHAFERSRLPRLIAVARPQNSGSIGVMRKVGMTFQKMIDFEGGEAVLYALDNPLASR